MTALRVLTIPFDAGAEGERMGAGPDALIAAGLLARLKVSHDVESVRVHPSAGWRAELQTTFDLHRRLAGEVSASVSAGRVPLVLVEIAA